MLDTTHNETIHFSCTRTKAVLNSKLDGVATADLVNPEALPGASTLLMLLHTAGKEVSTCQVHARCGCKTRLFYLAGPAGVC